MENGYLLIILTIVISNYFCKFFFSKNNTYKYIFLNTLGLTLLLIYLLNMLLLTVQHGISNVNVSFTSLTNLLGETFGYILPIVTIVYFVIRFKGKK
jgi:hypothetical protein